MRRGIKLTLSMIAIIGMTACTRFHESAPIHDAAAVDTYDHSDNIREDRIFSDGYVRAAD